MAKTKRTSVERERDLEAITGLYLRGVSQSEIAAQLGVTQQQVSYDLKVVQRRWAEKTVINLDAAKQKELARIDLLEREYWQAWERSKGERSKARQETAGMDKQGRPIVRRSVAEKEKLIGNPAYLTGVQWCISERCKLLGIYGAVKVDANVNANTNNKTTLESTGTVKLVVEYVDDPNVE